MLHNDDVMIGGFFDETLFPGIMKMIQYGADQLIESGAPELASTFITDAVAAALTVAAPEAAALILPGS